VDAIPLEALLALLFLLLGFSAFFSGSETALMAVNRYRLRHRADQGHRGALRAQQLLERPDRLIGLILLGNNFINILITQLATYIGYRAFGDAGIAITTGLLTLVLLIFAELAPKTLAALNAERIAFPAALVYRPLLRLTFPLVWVVNSIANGLLKLFGASNDTASGHDLSREELRSVVSQAGVLIPPEHQTMLTSVLDLERVTVEDIMVPRNEIFGIDLADDWEVILGQISNAAYSRMPVFRGSIDNVLGILNLRHLIALQKPAELSRSGLEAVLREPYFVPEGTSLNRQLLNFQRERQRIGMVVDEYGDIQGLVTLEDILEEIVGEFTTDPYALSSDYHPQPDGSTILDASLHVREVNRALGIALPTDGPRTINGLILEHLEEIPDAKATVLIAGYPIEIVHTKNNVVRTVRIRPRLSRFRPEQRTA